MKYLMPLHSVQWVLFSNSLAHVSAKFLVFHYFKIKLNEFWGLGVHRMYMLAVTSINFTYNLHVSWLEYADIILNGHTL